ncbi:MAG: GerMN domain-containing protein [Clostridiales bacterium]|jgi:germination protein M|nr:GerMN domain-containing protein [Clostridiales bacterium]
MKQTWLWLGISLAVVVLALWGGLVLLPHWLQQTADPDPASYRQPYLSTDEQSFTTVYYTTGDKRYLLPLTIPINNTREVAKIALEKLLAGPPDEFSSSVIPEGTKLRDVYMVGDTIFVDLTKDFLEVGEEEAQAAVDCIVQTVLPVTSRYLLQIMVEGQVCPELAGTDISLPLDDTPFNILNPQEAPKGKDICLITAYFCDEYAMYLVPVSIAMPRDLLMAAEDPELFLARETIELLLLGPDEDSGLFATFYPGAQLLSLEIKESIAYVNLSAEALDYGGGAAFEQLFVKSLVYSLTDLTGINAVQILIEGEIEQYLPEGMDVSTPIFPYDKINEPFQRAGGYN